MIKTRAAAQIRSHAQKLIIKIRKKFKIKQITFTLKELFSERYMDKVDQDLVNHVKYHPGEINVLLIYLDPIRKHFLQF